MPKYITQSGLTGTSKEILKLNVPYGLLLADNEGTALMQKFMDKLRDDAPGLAEDGIREWRFDRTRLLKFDIAWPDAKVGVEITGGVWNGGGHSRGSGMVRDSKKFNLAASQGWLLLHFPNTAMRKDWPEYLDALGRAITRQETINAFVKQIADATKPGEKPTLRPSDIHAAATYILRKQGL